jgi:1-acylglycerone phosphate reductase
LSGKLHILINNAGTGSVGPLLNEPLQTARNIMEVNVLGTLAVTQAFAKLLIQTGMSEARAGSSFRPKIVNIGSIVGVRGMPLGGIYSPSKAAIHNLSDSLRIEVKPLGLDVVVVARKFEKA